MIYDKHFTAIVSLFRTTRKLQAYQLYEGYEYYKNSEYSENFARILLVKPALIFF